MKWYWKGIVQEPVSNSLYGTGIKTFLTMPSPTVHKYIASKSTILKIFFFIAQAVAQLQVPALWEALI